MVVIACWRRYLFADTTTCQSGMLATMYALYLCFRLPTEPKDFKQIFLDHIRHIFNMSLHTGVLKKSGSKPGTALEALAESALLETMCPVVRVT